jgi:hypothetical protein
MFHNIQNRTHTKSHTSIELPFRPGQDYFRTILSDPDLNSDQEFIIFTGPDKQIILDQTRSESATLDETILFFSKVLKNQRRVPTGRVRQIRNYLTAIISDHLSLTILFWLVFRIWFRMDLHKVCHPDPDPH